MAREIKTKKEKKRESKRDWERELGKDREMRKTERETILERHKGYICNI